MYYFFLVLTLLLTDLYLFLNRNLWISLLFTFIALILFILLHKKYLKGILGFLCFVVVMVAIVLLTSAPKKLKPATFEGAKITDPIHVTEGTLTGVYNQDESVEVYAGIPYAQAPVGDLRWKEPQDALPYDEVLAADHFAPMSMQKQTNQAISSLSEIIFYHNINRTIHDRYTPMMSEDSLYLNIYKPSGNKENLPVVFYVHGGSLTTGQSWWEDYNGESFAKNDVIFVTFGYRLGALGYYADENLQVESPNHTTGMYGFLDQVKALQWVNENIENFGGDSSNITIAGESAGSSSVNALSTSPLTKGLFKYAIAESSSITAKTPAHSYMNFDQAIALGQSLRDDLHAYTPEELRNVPAEKIANTSTTYGTINAMTNDGYALTKSPYETYLANEQNEQALLTGYNEHDGDFFMLLSGNINAKNYAEKIQESYPDIADQLLQMYPATTDSQAKENYTTIYNAYTFGYGHHVWSNLASQNEPVYRYYFTKENGSIGSNHTGELPYAYGNLWVNPSAYNDSDYALSNTMMHAWIQFAKTGNPNSPDFNLWQQYSNNNVIEFGEQVRMIQDPNIAIYQLLDSKNQ